MLVHALNGCQPQRAIFLQQLHNKNLRLLRNCIPYLRFKPQFSTLDFLYGFFQAVTFEGHAATKHDIDQHSQAPHIAFHIIMTCQDLWSAVLWSSTSAELVLAIGEHTQTPINHLHYVLLSYSLDEDVLGLDVAMCDLVDVDVGQGFQDLVYDLYRQLLRKLTGIYNLIKKLPSIEVFSDDVPFLLGLVVLVDLDDIGVIQFLEEFEFIDGVGRGADFFVDDFKSALEAQLLVGDQEDGPEGALAEFAIEEVDLAD